MDEISANFANEILKPASQLYWLNLFFKIDARTLRRWKLRHPGLGSNCTIAQLERWLFNWLSPLALQKASRRIAKAERRARKRADRQAEKKIARKKNNLKEKTDKLRNTCDRYYGADDKLSPEKAIELITPFCQRLGRFFGKRCNHAFDAEDFTQVMFSSIIGHGRPESLSMFQRISKCDAKDFLGVEVRQRNRFHQESYEFFSNYGAGAIRGQMTKIPSMQNEGRHSDYLYR